MFKGMTLGRKLGCGFGAVVLIMGVLGVTTYVMFTRVDANVAELSGHHLPAAKHASGGDPHAWRAAAPVVAQIVGPRDLLDPTRRRG